MIALSIDCSEFVSCESDFGNRSLRVLLDLVLKVVRKVFLPLHSVDCVQEVLLLRNCNAHRLREITKKVEVRSELVELGMPRKNRAVYSRSLFELLVKCFQQCQESGARVFQGWCQSRGHYHDACSVLLLFIVKQVSSLLPRDVNSDRNRCDTSYGLNPCGLFACSKCAPANKFAIHAVSPVSWGQA